jgi:hypothetical protein
MEEKIGALQVKLPEIKKSDSKDQNVDRLKHLSQGGRHPTLFRSPSGQGTWTPAPANSNEGQFLAKQVGRLQ